MIMRLVVGLVVLGVLWSVDGRRMKIRSVRFNKATSTFNPRIMEFYEIFITPHSNGQLMGMNARLLVNVTEQLHVAVSVLMRNQAKDLYKKIVAYNFDFCRLGVDFMRQTIVHVWLKNIKKYSNLPGRCPVMAGVYYVSNLRMNTASVPVFLNSGEYIFNVMVHVKTGLGRELLSNSSLGMVIVRD